MHVVHGLHTITFAMFDARSASGSGCGLDASPSIDSSSSFASRAARRSQEDGGRSVDGLEQATSKSGLPAQGLVTRMLPCCDFQPLVTSPERLASPWNVEATLLSCCSAMRCCVDHHETGIALMNPGRSFLEFLDLRPIPPRDRVIAGRAQHQYSYSPLCGFSHDWHSYRYSYSYSFLCVLSFSLVLVLCSSCTYECSTHTRTLC